MHYTKIDLEKFTPSSDIANCRKSITITRVSCQGMATVVVLIEWTCHSDW